MSPEEFGRALAQLIEASRTLILLPLDDMAEYVDAVESMGEEIAPEVWTPERRETASHAGRLIAAANHVVATAAMGGESV